MIYTDCVVIMKPVHDLTSPEVKALIPWGVIPHVWTYSTATLVKKWEGESLTATWHHSA